MRKITQRLLLLALMLMPMLAMSQIRISQYAMEAGVDSTKWITLPADTAITKTIISNGGDARASAVIDMGFNFVFAGTTYTQFSSNTDGNMRLGATATSTEAYGTPFGEYNISENLPKINGMGCDGKMVGGGYVKYAVMGATPNRILVVEYKTAEYYGSSTSDLSWQVQLYETSNDIQLVYSSVAPIEAPSSFQIGMAASETDVLTVNTSTNTMTAGVTDTKQNAWPSVNTFYRFYIPTCFRPTGLEATSISAYSADFRWQRSMLDQSAWEYVCVASGSALDWQNASSVNDTTVSISNLQPNTEYTLYLRTNCSADDHSDPVTYVFRTNCVTLDVPYLEDFESYADEGFPNCWKSYTGESAVQTNTSYFDYSYAGANCMTIDANDILVLPKVNLAANQMMLIAQFKGESDAGSLEIGYVTDPALMDFTPFTTVAPMHNSYQEYLIDFSSLEITDTVQIAIKRIPGDYNWYRFFMDDIQIIKASTCPRPGYAYVTNVTHNSIQLEWEPNDNVASYDVAYGLTDTIENATIENVLGQANYTISNLQSETIYHLWVRNMCESDSSMWRSVGTATTKKSCASVIDVNVTSISNSSAAISWTIDNSYGTDATSVDISWKKSIDTVWSTPVNLVDQNYYFLQGLESGYLYEVRLRTHCSEDTSSDVIVDFITTPCGVSTPMSDATTDKMPFGGYYRFCYSQMLYPASVMAGVDTIRGIAVKIAETENTISRTVDVYIGNTSQSTLSTGTRIQDSTLTKVAANIIVDPVRPGWLSIMFDTIFVYDGTSNLVISVDDNTDQYRKRIYIYYNVSVGSSIYTQNDYDDVDPMDAIVSDLVFLNGAPVMMFISTCETESCTAPIVALGDVTESAITLSWQASAGTQCVLGHKLASETEWTTEAATGTTHTFSDLQSGSLYNVRVGSICGSDTLYSELEVFTNCVSYDVPFIENFDDAILTCWTIGNKPNTNGRVMWEDSLVTFDYNEGAYLITPRLTPELNTLQVSFLAGSTDDYSDGSIEVLIGSDPDNFNTFIAVDTIPLWAGTPLSLQIISLAKYVGNMHYVMFSTITGEALLDSIRIETIPECSMPTDLVVSNITADGATVRWTDNGQTVDKWLVYYTKVGSSTTIIEEVSVDDGQSNTVTGLEANTEYNVSVATVCTSGDTVETLYPTSFRTQCATITLPYHEDFEGIESANYHMCWYRDVTVYIGDDIPVPCVYLSDNGSKAVVTSGNKGIASPLIPIPANQISVNFDFMVQDTAHSGDLVVGYVTNPSDLSAMVAVDTIVADTTSWNNYTVDFNTLTITDTVYVVFKNIRNTTTGFSWWQEYYFMWIDNIDFSVYSSCERPTGVEVSNIAATTATVNITDPNNTNNYTVAWNTVADINTATTLNVTTTSAQLTNLQSGTTYYVWARANCNASSQSAWVAGGSFKTECLPLAIPYNENFDSYTYGLGITFTLPDGFPNHTMPECWKIDGMNYTGDAPIAMICTDMEYALSGNSFVVETSDEYPMTAVLPAFTAPTDSLMISFSYRNNDLDATENDFVLGIMTDNDDTSTFIPLKPLPASETYVSVEHAFRLDNAVAAGTNYYIAFRFGTTSAFHIVAIDNLSVTYAPSCIRPQEIAIRNINATTLELEWIGSSASYEVQYRPMGATAWSTSTTTTNSITLNNLVSDTLYNIQVRGICGANDTSEWTPIFSVTMPCGAALIPWSENFESYANVAYDSYGRPDDYPNHPLPSCWIFCTMTASDYGGPAAWLNSQPNSLWSHYNTIDGVSLKLRGNYSQPTYVVLPLMDAAIDTLAMYFDYAMPSYAEPLQLGVMTNPYDFSTFTAVETYPVFDSAHTAEHYFVTDNLNADETYYIAILSGYTTQDLVIDNLRIEYTPSCIRPAHLEAYAISNSTANIKWSTTADNAEVEYRVMGDTVWTTTIVNNARMVTLTGLTGNTEYEVAVRSLCSATDTSLWSDVLSFKTDCDNYSLPFFEDFSSDISTLDCWSFYDGLVDSVMAGTASLIPTDAIESNWNHDEDTNILVGPHAWINIYGSSRADWMVTPRLTITPDAVLSFDVAFADYGDSIPAENFSDDKFYVMVTADNGTTWNKLITWGADSTNTYPLDSLHIYADSIGVTLNQYAGQTIRIAFYGESTEYGGDNNLYLDNIKVEAPACEVPSNVAIVADAISATLTWEGSGQNYEITLRESGAEWMDTVTVTGLTHTFSGLMPEVNYEYRLRNVCAVGDYSEWVDGAFTTLPLPCEKPVVNVTDITNEGATFTWAEGENHQAWEVNVFNTMINETYDVTAATYTATGLEHATEYKVAVRAKCAENVYSDWSDTIPFSTLDCLPVSGVAISEITENSAKVTWTAGAEEANWQINYGPQDFGQGEGEMADATATNYTITGLEAETAYDVYVRAMCSEDFYSVWSEVVRFTTLEGQEGIDGVEGNFQFTIYPNPTSASTTISLNGIEGKVTISVVDMNGRTVTSEAIECGVDCEKRLDVAGLAQGTYFVRVLGDDINSVRKLIVR